jgi:hypothetical protein
MSRASPAGQAVSVLIAVVAAVAAALGLDACRVGTPVADALVSPYPDSAAVDVATDADARPPACDLLKQDCPNEGTCYPVDDVRGATSCELTGSAPATTPCVMSLECDAREACVLVPESQIMMCVSLCDPAAVQTGCQPGAPCRLLAGYRAGYCVP